MLYKSMVINGYHLMENSVTPEALHPDIRVALDMIKLCSDKVDFLCNAIQKYGNFELKNYVSENLHKVEEGVMDDINLSFESNKKLFTEYNQIDRIAEARHRDVVQRLEKLGLVENLDKMFPEDEESTEDRNSL